MKRRIILVLAVLAVGLIPGTAHASFPWSDRAPSNVAQCNPNAVADIEGEGSPGSITAYVENCTDTARTFTVTAVLRLPGGRSARIVGSESFAPHEEAALTGTFDSEPGSITAKLKVLEGRTLWAMSTIGFDGARIDAPTSSQNCTPVLAPVVCLEINGSGLHVNYFRVQAIFSHEVEVGQTVKGYWRVKNGTGSNIVLQTALKTYTVQAGTWYSWTFTVNKTYANGWTACGQFLDTVPGGQFNTYQPCGSIHS